jgi:hypothetical protein
MRTFAPIQRFGSNSVNAVAPLFAAFFATTTVYDPHVVTGAATLRAIGNRQFPLHLLMMRLSRRNHLFHTRRCPDNDFVTEFPLTHLTGHIKHRLLRRQALA